jgi:hypothetical protein
VGNGGFDLKKENGKNRQKVEKSDKIFAKSDNINAKNGNWRGEGVQIWQKCCHFFFVKDLCYKAKKEGKMKKIEKK